MWNVKRLSNTERDPYCFLNLRDTVKQTMSSSTPAYAGAGSDRGSSSYFFYHRKHRNNRNPSPLGRHWLAQQFDCWVQMSRRIESGRTQLCNTVRKCRARAKKR